MSRPKDGHGAPGSGKQPPSTMFWKQQLLDSCCFRVTSLFHPKSRNDPDRTKPLPHLLDRMYRGGELQCRVRLGTGLKLEQQGSPWKPDRPLRDPCLDPDFYVLSVEAFPFSSKCRNCTRVQQQAWNEECTSSTTAVT